MYDHSLSSDGIDDFFWPVLHKEITDSATDFLYLSANYLKKFDDKDVSVSVYKLTMKYFVAQMGGILQACLVHKRFLENNKSPVVPDDWLIYPYIFRNQAPPIPSLIYKLKNPCVKQSLLKRLANPKKALKIIKKISIKPSNLEIDGLKIRPITEKILVNNIIATQRTPLIIERSKLSTSEVIFSNVQRWFKNISEEEFLLHQELRKESVENSVLQIVKKIFQKNDLKYSDYINNHLKQYLGELYSALGIHYTRLLNMDKLPRELWTGTGGNIWDLTLRLAVLNKGGVVVGHDHGGGTAHVNIPVVGYVELWACSKFVTFNEKQAQLIRKSMKNWPLLDNSNPEIIGISRKNRGNVSNKSKTSGVKNILFLSTLYDRDRGRSFAFYPDIIYTDWQARFISNVEKWGYKVFLKPHPESQIKPHPQLQSKFNIDIIDGLFSDVLQDIDLIIFDYTYTTVFLEALKTDIPILVLEFDNIPWHENAKHLLKKRCGFVEGEFDNNNRVKIDWNNVHKEIKNAPSKRFNREILEEFYL